MEWSSEYIIGNEVIDNHHKMIFKMVDDFRKALDENRGGSVYSELLRSLSAYTQAHFKIEEQCMDEQNCPAAEHDKEEHAKFIDVLSGYQQRCSAKGFDHTDACSLVNTIDNWLSEHICGVDMQLKPSEES